AYLLHLVRRHHGVAVNRVVLKPGRLYLARFHHTLTYSITRFSLALCRHLIKADGHHLHMQVDPVEQRPAHLAEVTLHHARRTDAFFFRMIVVTTRAWVHARHEHEVGRVIDRYLSPRDGYPALFHWLAHHF